jgi:uncharacterized phage-like protein YoqJ
MIDRKRTACFTGHRNIPVNDRVKLDKLLDNVIEALFNKGVVFFGCGGAYGFDMMAEYAVLRAKERHKEIKLILVLPCKEQDKYWNDESKAMYKDILSKADKIVYTSEVYTSDCMHNRNRHLVDYSGYCIAYCTKQSGGTLFTINYARDSGVKVVNLADYL